MCTCIFHLADTADSELFILYFQILTPLQSGLRIFSINIEKRKQYPCYLKVVHKKKSSICSLFFLPKLKWVTFQIFFLLNLISFSDKLHYS